MSTSNAAELLSSTLTDDVPFELSDDSDEEYEQMRQTAQARYDALDKLRRQQRLQHHQMGVEEDLSESCGESSTHHQENLTFRTRSKQPNQNHNNGETNNNKNLRSFDEINTAPFYPNGYRESYGMKKSLRCENWSKPTFLSITFICICVFFQIFEMMEESRNVSFTNSDSQMTSEDKHEYNTDLQDEGDNPNQLVDLNKDDENLDNNNMTFDLRDEVGKESKDFLANIADIYSIYYPGKEFPLFWHITHSTAPAIKTVMECVGIVTAWSMGIGSGHGHYSDLKIIEMDGMKYLNVDVTTPAGIERAIRLNIVSSGMNDLIIVSPLLYPVSKLFSPNNKARLITFLRNPIHRAIENYQFYSTPGPRFDPEVASMSPLDYAKSHMCENNRITRSLTNTWTEALNENHLKLAKEILRQKCFIGLYSKLEDSLDRIERFFHWKKPPTKVTEEMNKLKECHNKNIENFNAHNVEIESIIPGEGNDLWNALHEKNIYDMRLYRYAEKLFVDQGVIYYKFRQQASHQASTKWTEDGRFPTEGYT